MSRRKTMACKTKGTKTMKPAKGNKK